jgi:hypothetical protein
VSEAAQLVRDNRDSLMSKHEQIIAASHAHLTEASRVFK